MFPLPLLIDVLGYVIEWLSALLCHQEKLGHLGHVRHQRWHSDKVQGRLCKCIGGAVSLKNRRRARAETLAHLDHLGHCFRSRALRV